MRGKNLLKENAIIILSLNQSEWRKLLLNQKQRNELLFVLAPFSKYAKLQNDMAVSDVHT